MTVLAALLLAAQPAPAAQPPERALLQGAVAPADAGSLARQGANPAIVFRQVCIEGGMALGASAAMPVSLDDLPEGLRSVLDAASIHHDLPEPFRRYRRQGTERVPNSFFRLREFQAFVMAPHQDHAPESTARQCAVFWRGTHWAELRETLRPWILIPDPAVPSTAYRDQVSIQSEVSGHRITVAVHGGWTMMRTMPAEDALPMDQVR